MCITFVYVEHNPSAKYKLILLNNRDEYLGRLTSTADWEDGILAGRDEKVKNVRGTWLGIDTTGRIGNLLTITVPMHEIKENCDSRGEIPLNYIKSGKGPEEFCESLIDHADKYNPFHILCFQRNVYDQYEFADLAKYLVGKIEFTRFSPGIYGFSNSSPYKPFKKVQRGVDKMRKIVEEIDKENLSESQIIERLLLLATDKHQCFPDEQLKQQCRRSNELCRYRSAIFVQYPDGIPFGTRSHTIIMVDRNNQATYYEKSMRERTNKVSEATWTQKMFHFDLI